MMRSDQYWNSPGALAGKGRWYSCRRTGKFEIHEHDGAPCNGMNVTARAASIDDRVSWRRGGGSLEREIACPAGRAPDGAGERIRPRRHVHQVVV